MEWMVGNYLMIKDYPNAKKWVDKLGTVFKNQEILGDWDLKGKTNRINFLGNWMMMNKRELGSWYTLQEGCIDYCDSRRQGHPARGLRLRRGGQHGIHGGRAGNGETFPLRGAPVGGTHQPVGHEFPLGIRRQGRVGPLRPHVGRRRGDGTPHRIRRGGNPLHQRFGTHHRILPWRGQADI